MKKSVIAILLCVAVIASLSVGALAAEGEEPTLIYMNEAPEDVRAEMSENAAALVRTDLFEVVYNKQLAVFLHSKPEDTQMTEIVRVDGPESAFPAEITMRTNLPAGAPFAVAMSNFRSGMWDIIWGVTDNMNGTVTFTVEGPMDLAVVQPSSAEEIRVPLKDIVVREVIEYSPYRKSVIVEENGTVLRDAGEGPGVYKIDYLEHPVLEGSAAAELFAKAFETLARENLVDIVNQPRTLARELPGYDLTNLGVRNLTYVSSTDPDAWPNNIVISTYLEPGEPFALAVSPDGTDTWDMADYFVNEDGTLTVRVLTTCVIATMIPVSEELPE